MVPIVNKKVAVSEISHVTTTMYFENLFGWSLFGRV